MVWSLLILRTPQTAELYIVERNELETNQATIQWLNLAHTSPTFVIRVGAEGDNGEIQSPKIIPNKDGDYWVAGKTLLKCGTEVESVFPVDTDTEGTLVGVYWRIATNLWDFQDRPSVFDALDIG